MVALSAIKKTISDTVFYTNYGTSSWGHRAGGVMSLFRRLGATNSPQQDGEEA